MGDNSNQNSDDEQPTETKRGEVVRFNLEPLTEELPSTSNNTDAAMNIKCEESSARLEDPTTSGDSSQSCQTAVMQPKTTANIGNSDGIPESSKSSEAATGKLGILSSSQVLQSVPKSPEIVRNKYSSARLMLESGNADYLLGREREIHKITEFFRRNLLKKLSGSIYISGYPGSGKTASVNYVLNLPEFQSGSIATVSLNCTNFKSTIAVFKEFFKKLNLQMDTSHTAINLIAAIQQHLQNDSKATVIILDEMESLLSLKCVLYTIFEWLALPNVNLMLVGIANSFDFSEKMLTRLDTRFQLKPLHLHFMPYGRENIVNVLASRLRAVDFVPPATIQFIAAKVSSLNGDMRRALEIAKQSIGLAGGDSQDLLPMQQKLVICTAILMLRSVDVCHLTISRLHKDYKRMCREHHIQPLEQEEFSGMVDLVEARGIFNVERKKQRRFFKITLACDESELINNLNDQQLFSSILNGSG